MNSPTGTLPLPQAGATHDAHAKPQGWRRWVLATNHKDIGTMYLSFSCLMWLVGGTFAMLIRLELFQPGLQVVEIGRGNRHALRDLGDTRIAGGTVQLCQQRTF